MAEIPGLTRTEYRERRTIPCTAVEEFEHRPAACARAIARHRRTLGGIFPASGEAPEDRELLSIVRDIATVDMVGHFTRFGFSFAIEAWMKAVHEAATGLLSNDVNSWFTGINTNVEGKQTRRIARYSGSAPAYRARCDEVAAANYREMVLS